MNQPAVVVRSHIKLRFKRAIPTPAALKEARQCLLHEVSAQLQDLDCWIQATTVVPNTYGDTLCAAVIEHRNMARAARALNDAGIKTPSGKNFRISQLSQWIGDANDADANPLLLDLARRLRSGSAYQQDRAQRQSAVAAQAYAEARS